MRLGDLYSQTFAYCDNSAVRTWSQDERSQNHEAVLGTSSSIPSGAFMYVGRRHEFPWVDEFWAMTSRPPQIKHKCQSPPRVMPATLKAFELMNDAQQATRDVFVCGAIMKNC